MRVPVSSTDAPGSSGRGSRRLGWLLGALGVAIVLAALPHVADRLADDDRNTSDGVFSETAEWIELLVEEEDYRKLAAHREEAVRSGILLADDDDFVPVTIRHAGRDLKARMRLKGDWTDHLKDEARWSFRIEMRGDDSFLGMRRFSLQHPMTRNYLYEWLFHRALAREDVMRLRYEFAPVRLHRVGKFSAARTINLGLYAIEQAFSPELPGTNRRREGVIVRLDESALWKHRAAAYAQGLGPHLARDKDLEREAVVTPFYPQRLLESAALGAQYERARDLLLDAVQRRKPWGQVFHLERLAAFNAVADVMGAHHGVYWHNTRFYYDSIASRLEPIGFDGNSGLSIERTVAVFNGLDEPGYARAYVAALNRISDPAWLESLFKETADEVQRLDLALAREYGVVFDPKVLEHNAAVIRDALHTPVMVKAFFDSFVDRRVVVRITSLTALPLEVVGLSVDGRRMLAEGDVRHLGGAESSFFEFTLPEHFETLFTDRVDRSRTRGFVYEKDASRIRIAYRPAGLKDVRYAEIHPWREYVGGWSESNLLHQKPNAPGQDFLKAAPDRSRYWVRPGRHTVRVPVVIPAETELVFAPGAILDLVQGGMLLSYAPVRMLGTPGAPVEILSSDQTGRGLIVLKAAGGSHLRHVRFAGLQAPRSGNWTVTGGVTFYESPVTMENVVFEDSQTEDALNIVRSKFLLRDVAFRNIRYDAFDGDFTEGEIHNARFENVGNDGLDFSGSTVMVTGATMTGIGDKGISAGEGSTLYVSGVAVSASEVAFASKDASRLTVTDSRIENTRVGFTAYMKKPEFGSGTIHAERIVQQGVEVDTLIDRTSSMVLDGRAVPRTSGVKASMYGAEYGAASER